MRLLIVDDNASVRRVITAMVLPLTTDICECMDGADAVSAYLAQRPDVVLMDIRMNKVDGIQATREIKAADQKARILIVTQYDDQELRRASIDAGACGYVLKENLLELVRLLEAMRPAY